MTKWDKILITTIIVISLISIGGITYYKSKGQDLYGIIEVDGEEIKNINLLEVEKPYTIKIENGVNYNIVEVSSGSIRFIEATCPDKDCIRIGKLDSPGEISVCLPNNTTIRVSGPGVGEDLDSKTY
ncbi:MAG TPA: NusG domain II-containing protein [Eubacteriaceae bacterium]|nr:NusG domain II-containing protein [Eubacteriaceae bacterium]